MLRSAAVVLDESDHVVRASAPAHALGIVRDGRVAPAAIRDLIALVRRDGVIRDEVLEVPRGPVGPGVLMVQVRVAQVSADHLVVLAEDLTQARRLEAIRRDFVVNVSHELKTPVGALALLAETVQDAADDPEAVRRFAGRMQAEATRLSALVHEIIELSRLQVAGALGQVGLVDVDTVLSEAVDRARTTAEAKHVAARHRRGARHARARPARPAGHRGAQPAGQRRRVLGEASHVGVGVRTRRRPRGDRGGRRGHRHHRGRAGARLRAVLPGGPRALARHRRHRPRPVASSSTSRRTTAAR